MSDDATPTQRLDVVAESAAVVTKRGPNPVYIALLVIGVLLLVGVVAIIVLLLNPGGGQVATGSTPTPSETTSPAPTPTATEDSQPLQESGGDPPLATFTTFKATTTEVSCVQHSSDPNPTMDVTWDTEGALSAWMWINVPDAYGSYEVPVHGGTTDMIDGGQFPCNSFDKVQYALTIVGEDGKHVTKTWVVTNVGESFED